MKNEKIIGVFRSSYCRVPLPDPSLIAVEVSHANEDESRMLNKHDYYATSKQKLHLQL